MQDKGCVVRIGRPTGGSRAISRGLRPLGPPALCCCAPLQPVDSCYTSSETPHGDRPMLQIVNYAVAACAFVALCGVAIAWAAHSVSVERLRPAEDTNNAG